MVNISHDIWVVRKSISYLNRPHCMWDGKKKQFVEIDENGKSIEVKRGRKKKTN